ncbi:MAG: hypothetical protein ABI416_18720 [Ginsengibacter sp.]
MSNPFSPAGINKCLIIGTSFLIISCGNNGDAFTSKERAVVTDSVKALTSSIARNVSSEGPIAWLRYFETSPGFYMASAGRLVFPDNEAAKYFIKNSLVRAVTKIELRWNNIRIDPLSPSLASIAAVFHEDITGNTGNKIVEDGYFTAIAERSTAGWQLRNAHWSVIPADKK